MPSTFVKTESGDGWAAVKLSSEGGLNRLGTETLTLLHAELAAALSPDCRCLAILGEGGSFAVGADLKEVGRLTPGMAREFSDLGNRISRLVEGSEAIVVAGIDGYCLGGGLDLALSADWRLATSRSVFGHPGADLGLITGFGGTQRLPRLIGRHRAAMWFYTGERVMAAQAYRDGFLQEVCSSVNFREVLENRLERFAAMPVPWIRHTKQNLRYGEEGWEGHRSVDAYPG